MDRFYILIMAVWIVLIFGGATFTHAQFNAAGDLRLLLEEGKSDKKAEPFTVSPESIKNERDGSETSSMAFGFDQERRSPVGALLRSFVVPGWGHHYVDSGNWRMGQYHLAAEALLIISWLGINRQSYVVEKNMYSHATAHTGVDLKEHGRAFELAVGNHDSYDSYIDFLERTRNWDKLDQFPDTPSYRWEWDSHEMRVEYRDMRSRRDNLDQQLPAIAAIMVVNRVLSGIGAYNRARSLNETHASLQVAPGPYFNGFQANIRLFF